MKNMLFAVSYIIAAVLAQYSWLTAMTEEQFKQEIAACWNEHEKTMQNLKESFKKEEKTTKEVVSKVLPAEEKDVEKAVEEVKISQAEVAKEVEVESVESAVVVQDSQEVKQDEKETVVEPIQKERVHRSKALQRAELELQAE